jgi:hypothetical protein
MREGDATKQPLSVGSEIPSAEGEVIVKPEGKQQKLTIRAKHLADPARVRAGATVFVVWLEPQGGEGPRQNIGVLTVNEDKEGKLETVTPYRDFRIFVTAERAPNVVEPSQPVMTASVRTAGAT